jgi:transposase
MRKIGRTRWRCFARACPVAAGKPKTTAAFSKRFISSPSRTFAGALCRSASVRGIACGDASIGWARLASSKPSSTRSRLWVQRPSPSDVRLHRRARACVGGRSKRGQEGQALGRSRGGFTTKIHAKSDASGDIIAFDLTAGQAFDGRHFDVLLDIGPDIQPRAVICDKGYASKANRDAARARGIAPVIPYKANEKNKPAFFAPTLYKARARIEQGVGRLKRFKRVALRCEKTARNFRSIVSFAAGLCLIKFVHTA